MFTVQRGSYVGIPTSRVSIFKLRQIFVLFSCLMQLQPGLGSIQKEFEFINSIPIPELEQQSKQFGTK